MKSLKTLKVTRRYFFHLEILIREILNLEDDMADIIIDYLEGGGFVYLEGGDAIGYDQAGNSELMELFGIQNSYDGTTNPINYLEGQEDALTAGQVFTSSSQQVIYLR